MRIIFLVPYPIGEAPSQRFRFESFFSDLRDADINFDVQSFIDIETWKILYKPGNHFRKVFGILKGFLRRVALLFRIHYYDRVFIHREASPLGPPVFEWFIAHVLRKKIIYDFDDAIWLPNVSSSNRFISKLKWYSKVSSICKWSYRISCGNEYLGQYAQQYNQLVHILPTIVDTDVFKPIPVEAHPLTIGWTGSVSTNIYLEQIEHILYEVQQQTNCDILCISNEPPRFSKVRFRFLKWKKQNEVDDLSQIDIGIMPLPDDEWSKGKCGFKLIQYLSLGIPSVASPVGVNPNIVIDGVSGFLCKTDLEWKEKLIELCRNPELRNAMGREGRIHVEKYYSKKAQLKAFLNLFA